MAAVHPTMATVSGMVPMHQTLAAPTPYNVYGKGVSPRPTPSPFSRVVLRPVHRHIWIVAGTSCCGKTTIARDLATRLGAGEYIEGDDVHPEANVKKMQAKQPLTDEDRAPWLQKLRSIAAHRLETSSKSSNVVITCSALKKKYRDFFRDAERIYPGIKVHFLFLMAPQGVLAARSAMRTEHWFGGADMIKSQFACLEIPDDHVERDAIIFDCTKSEIVVAANVQREVQGQLLADSI